MNVVSKFRILLDPNKDAFGRENNGIPNRQVASELHEAGIDVRWCRTEGEQCHSKILMKRNAQQAEMILGSANFTVRNLKNYNLETNMRVVGQPQAEVFRDAQQYFEGAWSNLNGRSMSVDYTQYAETRSLNIGCIALWNGAAGLCFDFKSPTPLFFKGRQSLQKEGFREIFYYQLFDSGFGGTKLIQLFIR